MLSQVVGHENAVHLLRSHSGGLQPSYILHGPGGVGKKFTALSMFAEMACTGTRAIGCECKACEQIANGSHPDLKVLAPEGQSYGIGQVQEVTEDARTYPTTAPYKFIIFDDADLLTLNAANSLLKTLEDGPPKTVFFFVLEDEDELLPTIQSRSVSVKFSTLTSSTILEFLSRLDADNEKVKLCTNLSGGSLSSALKYLRGGGLGDRDEALAFLRGLPRKPYHQVIDGIDKAENLETLFYLLRCAFTDMLLLSRPGLEGRVVNFDKIEDLRKCRAALGDVTVAYAVEELNRLCMKMPLIKGTFPVHLKAALLRVRRTVRAEDSR